MRGGVQRAGAGFTMLELLTVMTVLGLLMLLVTESLTNIQSTQTFQRGQARADEVADRVAREIDHDVAYATRIFTAGTVADGYLGVLDIDSKKIAASSRLPVLTAYGYFDRDPIDAKETGNVLMLGTTGETITLDVGSSDFVRVDTHTFVVYHTTPQAKTGTDLERWESERIANQGDIVHVEDPMRRSALLLQLYANDIRTTWATLEPHGTGLFKIVKNGDAATLVPFEPADRIPMSRKLTRHTMLATKRLGIARNGQAPDLPVPAFARTDGTAFPGGFEVKVDGPATGKLVMVRLVLIGRTGRQVNFARVQRLISAPGG